MRKIFTQHVYTDTYGIYIRTCESVSILLLPVVIVCRLLLNSIQQQRNDGRGSERIHNTHIDNNNCTDTSKAYIKRQEKQNKTIAKVHKN